MLGNEVIANGLATMLVILVQRRAWNEGFSGEAMAGTRKDHGYSVIWGKGKIQGGYKRLELLGHGGENWVGESVQGLPPSIVMDGGVHEPNNNMVRRESDNGEVGGRQRRRGFDTISKNVPSIDGGKYGFSWMWRKISILTMDPKRYVILLCFLMQIFGKKKKNKKKKIRILYKPKLVLLDASLMLVTTWVLH